MSRGAHESRVQRWGRRAFTLPGYVLGFVGLVTLLPFLLPVTVAVDLTRDSRLPATRLLLFAVAFLGCETLGLAACLAVWVAPVRDRERMLRWHYRLQSLWARSVFAAASYIFGFRVEIEDEGAVGRGPLLVFARHASIADTLLPAVFLAHRHGLRLRYVLKRELLWDPCLDVVGHRLPNVFVRRGSGDRGGEIAALVALTAGLGVGEGVLIYPEGTRFTPAKRERALNAIARHDPERATLVAERRYVLPPRTGGPLALIEAMPEAEVLFLAHFGLESAGRLGDVLRGELIGRSVRMGFWRVRGRDIPRQRGERVKWLDAQWARMDEWVGMHAAAGKPLARAERSVGKRLFSDSA